MLKKKILIVDDEPFTVEMLKTFLEINNYDTSGALTGMDGLILAQVEKPSVLILDLMLPDLEGFEICKQLRNQADTANLPILILSARIEPSIRQRALELGADAYLTKPVKFPELLSTLERIYQSRQSYPNSSAPSAL